MIGCEGWAKFAEENGLTWEIGPPKYQDQYGKEYLTLIWDPRDFSKQVLKVLNGNKYVIVRIFPHPAEREGLTRMRFSSYPSKPA